MHIDTARTILRPRMRHRRGSASHRSAQRSHG
jgi:hypothetical protein